MCLPRLVTETLLVFAFAPLLAQWSWEPVLLTILALWLSVPLVLDAPGKEVYLLSASPL
jgi:hypothetical protein